MLRRSSIRSRGHMTPFWSTKDAGLLLPISSTGLRLWLQKGNPGTGSTWNDASLRNNHGTLINATWGGGVVVFDGSGDYVEGFSESISPSGERTLIVIATNDAPTTRAGMLGTRGATGADPGFFFGFNSSGHLNYTIIGMAAYTQSITYSAGERAMFSLTHDASHEVTFYKNDSSVGSTTAGGYDSPSAFSGRVGGEQEGSAAENWDGTIEDVIIYTRALSSGEIASIYATLF